jgi:hypothetical protein
MNAQNKLPKHELNAKFSYAQLKKTKGERPQFPLPADIVLFRPGTYSNVEFLIDHNVEVIGMSSFFTGSNLLLFIYFY